MNISGIELVAIYVDNLEEAISFYSDLFQTEFRISSTKLKEGMVRFAQTPFGFELIERQNGQAGSDVVRSFHFRVDDVGKAKEEMKRRGFDPVDEVKNEEVWGLIYSIRGLRIILLNHKSRLWT